MFHLRKILMLSTVLALGLGMAGCDNSPAPPETGVRKTNPDRLTLGPDGKTSEQRNVGRRIVQDNLPGAEQWFYLINDQGQVIFESPVDGKVTSSGKSLTPTEVASIDGEYIGDEFQGFRVDFNGVTRRTNQVLGDDGTYRSGGSTSYLYFWDPGGRYFQIFDGVSLTPIISNVPLRFDKATLTIQVSGPPSAKNIAPEVVESPPQ